MNQPPANEMGDLRPTIYMRSVTSRYRNALDSGLSDHEAREEAWPSVVQPSPQTS